VATEFRVGRALLAGDAAHINNPLGAFGLNSGIHDALNLTEKLAAVINGGADASLLDRYVRQRRSTNMEYVQTHSIRNKQMLEERDPAEKKKYFDEIRRTAGDPKLAREYLLISSMIASIRHAASIQ
jgi:3-(3-hydroxy-phenyl)propionate hydroxylase